MNKSDDGMKVKVNLCHCIHTHIGISRNKIKQCRVRAERKYGKSITNKKALYHMRYRVSIPYAIRECEGE
jgi:hypothetical protein